jgi:hypothetical protein
VAVSDDCDWAQNARGTEVGFDVDFFDACDLRVDLNVFPWPWDSIDQGDSQDDTDTAADVKP